MVIDTALRERQARAEPIRVAMIGAGFMGRGLANQIVNSVPGMDLVAIVNRHVAAAADAYGHAGKTGVLFASGQRDVEKAIARGEPVITDDPTVVTESPQVDAILEVTGSIDYAAQVVLDAVGNRKHVVLMNAEVDATVGPILKTYADRAGVVYTACDGDQPGVEMNLHRFVSGIGLTPLVCGNIKGLQDPYRTPATQKAFAERWGQNPRMVTSFADGSKISFEQAIVANGTGMTVARRGMYGFEHDGHVDELTERYDIDELRALGGIVDFVVGSRPSPGVFVLAAHDDPRQRHYLDLYKLGQGPLYSFYTPYHLCHFEAPLSVARAVLFDDAVLAPAGGPRVEVVATAKRDLHAGEPLDGIGGFTHYGQCETADLTATDRLLPQGIAEGCLLRRDVDKDTVLTYDDVDVPTGRLSDKLRREQADAFGLAG